MRTNSQPPLRIVTAALACVAACTACEQTAIGPTDEALALPALSLVQRGPQTLELRIAGPDGLRALQAELRYDPTALRLKTVQAGRDAVGLDRIFFSDLKQAKGTVLLGLADTRNVRLPARGTLLRITVAAANRGGQTRVHLDAIVAVRHPNFRLALPATSLQVTR